MTCTVDPRCIARDLGAIAAIYIAIMHIPLKINETK